MSEPTSPEPRIAVLPTHVIDQIAAGEVIERPASVVKELVDNALDAGARTIVVETSAGGRGLVRVSDDGCGMGPRDAVLAFERHATSKLRQVDDLWGLASMGFRGEAMPSIASISRMTLTTRRACDEAATRVELEGGKLISVGEIGAPVGTTVEVVDLLFNQPARLKFLKADATEASHITDLIGKIAMAHPHVHLRLRHRSPSGEPRTALELPPDRDGFARAQALLGPRVAAQLVPAVGEENGISVEAFLGAPELAQTTARGVQIFVGKRPVRDRGVLHAVTMGYGELIPRGRYPVAVVHLAVQPGMVDVNVHPQKLEVRFSDPNAIGAAVRHVVQTGIAAARRSWTASSTGAPWAGAIQMTAIASAAPPLPFDGKAATPLAQRYAREQRSRSGQGSLGFGRHREDPAAAASPREWIADVRKSTHDRPEGRAASEHERLVAAYARSQQRAGGTGAVVDEATTPDRVVPLATDPPREVEAPVAFAEGSGPVTGNGYFAGLRFLGQLDLTYLVCEAAGELVLIDQHAAHERVELARLEARRVGEAGSRHDAIQKLLFPVTIEASPAQLELVGRVGPSLAEVGFEVEPFGKATLAIKSVPAGIRHGDPTQLLRRLLDEWARDGAPADEVRVSRMLAEIACHSVVRAGDRLAAGEAEALLRSLDSVVYATDPERSAAPHGRALLLRFPLAEIGRRFGR